MSRQNEIAERPKGGHNKSRRTEQAIAALLRCKTVKEAAHECGLNYGTLKTWLTEDWFLGEYREAKDELLDGVVNQLRDAGNDAVALLRKIVHNNKLAPTPRVSAARAILELLLKAVETQDIIARLERIETAQKDIRL